MSEEKKLTKKEIKNINRIENWVVAEQNLKLLYEDRIKGLDEKLKKFIFDNLKELNKDKYCQKDGDVEFIKTVLKYFGLNEKDVKSKIKDVEGFYKTFNKVVNKEVKKQSEKEVKDYTNGKVKKEVKKQIKK